LVGEIETWLVSYLSELATRVAPRVLAVKYPVASDVLPLWRDAFAKAGLRLQLVWATRNANDNVASLRTFGNDTGRAEWRYLLRMRNLTQDLPPDVLLLPYEGWTRNAGAQMQALADFVGLPPPDEASLRDLFDPSINHSGEAAEPLELNPLTQEVSSLISGRLGLASDLFGPDLAELRALSSKIAAASSWRMAQEAPAIRRKEGSPTVPFAEQELRSKCKQLAAKNAQLAAENAELADQAAETRWEAEEFQSRCKQLARDNARLAAEHQRRADEAELRLAQTTKEFQATNQQLAQDNARLAAEHADARLLAEEHQRRAVDAEDRLTAERKKLSAAERKSAEAERRSAEAEAERKRAEAAAERKRAEAEAERKKLAAAERKNAEAERKRAEAEAERLDKLRRAEWKRMKAEPEYRLGRLIMEAYGRPLAKGLRLPAALLALRADNRRRRAAKEAFPPSGEGKRK
jgi:hypothetical protein